MTEIGQFSIFQSLGGVVQLNVALGRETVWLSQAQLSELFGCERSVVSKHINNLFKEDELD